jgi:hypothetical protein
MIFAVTQNAMSVLKEPGGKRNRYVQVGARPTRATLTLTTVMTSSREPIRSAEAVTQ